MDIDSTSNQYEHNFLEFKIGYQVGCSLMQRSQTIFVFRVDISAGYN